MRLLADHCDLYNAALQERRDAWRMRNLSVSYGGQSAQLNAYFKRVRKAEKGRRQAGSGENLRQRTVGYPRFKPRQRFDRCCSSPGMAPRSVG